MLPPYVYIRVNPSLLIGPIKRGYLQLALGIIRTEFGLPTGSQGEYLAVNPLYAESANGTETIPGYIPSQYVFDL